ncbi:hypothetical protein [Clostridium sp.]|uniref:hypothetical protein n=1 Tax=Clostridium sp. TaxID=1506 RepID=UPI003D6D52B5
MLKWILNKGLRFQIILVLCLALSVPVAALIWNIAVPSNMSQAVRAMQKDKSRNLLEYVDETIDKKQISNFNNIGNAESLISSSLEPLSRTVRDTRIGIYVSSNKKRYTYGKMVDNRPHRKTQEINYADIESGIDESLKAVIATKTDRVDYIEMNN